MRPCRFGRNRRAGPRPVDALHSHADRSRLHYPQAPDNRITDIRLVATIALYAAALAGPALAQDSTANASAAGGASSEAAGHLAASGVQTVVGVAAVPVSAAGAGLAVAGSVAGTGASVLTGAGAAASEVADGMSGAATGPLKVDDRVVVAPDPAPQVPYDVREPAKR